MKEDEVLKPNEDADAEIKQGVINVKKSKTTHLRVTGLSGAYMGIVFNNEGVSDLPVPGEVRDEIKKQFPDFQIKEIDAPAS